MRYYRNFCFVERINGRAVLDEEYHLRYLCDCLDNSWDLYECYLPEDFKYNEKVTEIKGELLDLLFSAMNYPPALGFARNEINWVFKNNKLPSKEEFISEYTKILKKHLKNPPNSNCFLAESLVNHGFRNKGYFYWIVGFNIERNKILYLSQDDYYIYDGDISDFIIEDLSLIEKVRKFGKSKII